MTVAYRIILPLLTTLIFTALFLISAPTTHADTLNQNQRLSLFVHLTGLQVALDDLEGRGRVLAAQITEEARIAELFAQVQQLRAILAQLLAARGLPAVENVSLESDYPVSPVSITFPQDGAHVFGKKGAVGASAPTAVGVQFFLDDTRLGAEDTVAPYSVPWDTTETSNGTHTLTAVARDVAGNKTDASIRVVVANTPTQPSSKTTVGVIRWDYWFENSPMGGYLRRSPQWNYRTPFFYSDTNDRWLGADPEVTDHEIELAHSAGIDYFIFQYLQGHHFVNNDAIGDCKSTPGASLGRQSFENYLSSTMRSQVNFAIMMAPYSIGCPDDWDKSIDTLASLTARSEYQTVLDGRPVVYLLPQYFLGIDGWTEVFARHGRTPRGFFDDFREKVKEESGKDPYVVVLSGVPEDAKKMVVAWGLDAISNYASNVTTLSGGNQGREWPFTKCRAVDQKFWNDVNSLGVQVAPIVTAGWDYRPVIDGPYTMRNSTPDYCTTATSQEVAGSVQSAKNWIGNHLNSTLARTIVLYAWNEHGEGGWVSPTYEQLNTRLNALRGVLRNDVPKPVESGAISLVGSWVTGSETKKDYRFQVTGWACRIGYNAPIAVSLYAGGDGSRDARGEHIITWYTTKQSGAGIRSACNSTSPEHSFILNIPYALVSSHAGENFTLYAEYTRDGTVHTKRIGAVGTIPD